MSTKKMSDFSSLTIGVLELQGDFAEHTAMLRQCSVGKVIGVRQAEDLECGLDALVFPGGESTTMSKLLVQQNMMTPIKQLAKQGLPMFGTCAGCILLARDIRQRPEQPRIGIMDIGVDRNAYGKQIDSFEAYVDPDAQLETGEPLRVVHIRAPVIVTVGKDVQVLASFNKKPILVQQNNILACTFHPEITKDTRVHQLFLRIVANWKNNGMEQVIQ